MRAAGAAAIFTLSAHQPRRDADAIALGNRLDELVRAHARLITALADLGGVTCDPCPDRARYTLARFRLSQASADRRAKLQQAIELLLANASSKDVQALRELQSGGSEMLLESSAHVGKWTIETVEADWPTYCAVSGMMRLRMMARIDAEKRVVYPLLKQALE